MAPEFTSPTLMTVGQVICYPFSKISKKMKGKEIYYPCVTFRNAKLELNFLSRLQPFHVRAPPIHTGKCHMVGFHINIFGLKYKRKWMAL